MIGQALGIAGQVGPGLSYNQYQVPNATVAAINATIAQAAAAGGGTVVIPFNTIDCTGAADSVAVTAVSNVVIQGGGFEFNFQAIPDDGGVTVKPLYGTVFTGTGVEIGIGFNTVDRGAIYGSNIAFSNAAIQHTGIINCAFKNLKYGIKIGAKFAAGALYSVFQNIAASGCTIGCYFENFLHCRFEDINVFRCSDTQIYFRGSSGSDLGPGNSLALRLVCTATAAANTSAQNMVARGIVLHARNATGVGMTFLFCQSNRFNNSTSIQAATMANASANITVTDGTQYCVGMPVVVSTNANPYTSTNMAGGGTPATITGAVNGFTNGWVYFVTSVVGNVIQLSTLVGGTAQNATGNTACFVHTYGMPCMELIADNDTSHITNTCLINPDLEAGGTCGLLLQGCNPITVGPVGGITDWPNNSGGGVSTIVARNSCNGVVALNQSMSAQLDASSLTLGLTGGVRSWVNRVNGQSGVGLQQTGNASAGELFLDPNNYMTEGAYPLGALSSQNGMALIGNAIGFAATGAYSGTLSSAFGPVIYLTGAGPFTLPVLSKTRGGAYNNGAAWILVNNQATAIVINAGGSNKINSPNSGSRTSITIPAFSSVWITGNVDGGGTGAQAGWITFGQTSSAFSFADSSGTPGNASHATQRGRVAIAAAGTTVTVTNPLCTVNSMIQVTIATNDATAVLKNVVPGAGSFVITLNAAATGTTKIDYNILGEF